MSEINFQETLEKKLNKVFNPVTPRTNYVEELHHRLTSETEVSVEYPNYIYSILTISSGLLFGVLLIKALRKIFKVLSGEKA